MPNFLIINPAAGRSCAARLEPAIQSELKRLGIPVEILRSTTPGGVALCVAEALTHRPERVLVAGGDGTVNEAVNGWVRAGGGAPLGVIPAGTGNDFMKMLSPHPRDWRAACQLIAKQRIRHVDIARCNDFYFVNSLGIGFDARVAVAANRMRWLYGKLVYAAALFRVLLFDYDTPTIRLTHDGTRLETRITLVAVHNGKVEGGSFKLAPEAEFDDGLLDVVLARGMKRLPLLALVPRVLAGRHLGHPAIRAFRTRQLLIESEQDLPIHADGEIRCHGVRRVEIELLPRKLMLLA